MQSMACYWIVLALFIVSIPGKVEGAIQYSVNSTYTIENQISINSHIFLAGDAAADFVSASVSHTSSTGSGSILMLVNDNGNSYNQE